MQQFNNGWEGCVQADYFRQPASLCDKDWCLNVLGSDAKLSQNYFYPEYKAQMQHLAAETVWQFRWEVVSGDVNEDASRLLQIYLLSYGRADANAVCNLHIRSPPPPPFLHAATSSSNTVGPQQQQFCSLTARPHSQVTEDACLQPCVCACVLFCLAQLQQQMVFLKSFHFTNPIILRVFHISSAASCTQEWKLTGVLPGGIRSWRCAVGSFSVSRSGLKCKSVFTIAVFSCCV